eukprot:768377-Hanusia_phi.AAC.9
MAFGRVGVLMEICGWGHEFPAELWGGLVVGAMGRIAHLFAAANMIIRQETATTTGGMVAKMKETITDPKKAVNSTKSMILLSRRFNTGFMDGWYGLPAGHVRPTERIHETVMREQRIVVMSKPRELKMTGEVKTSRDQIRNWIQAKEELGIEVEQGAISVMSTMHRLNKKSDDCFVQLWKGPIVNNEPDKCDDLQFFPVDNLPENTIEHVRQGIQCVFDNIPFSEYGVEGMVKAKD